MYWRINKSKSLRLDLRFSHRDYTPCSPTKVWRKLRRNLCLYLHGSRLIHASCSKQSCLVLLLASCWLLRKAVTSQEIAFFMVTAATSSGPANSSCQLLSAQIAPAEMPPGLYLEQVEIASFQCVIHSTYGRSAHWTLRAAQTDTQKLDKKSSVFWDVTPCSRVESQPNKVSKSRE
jgi:hypothetical protein